MANHRIPLPVPYQEATSELFMPSPSPAPAPSVTMRDVLAALFRHKGLILACFLLVTAAAGALLYELPPTYQSEAKVLIRVEEQGSPAFFAGIAAYRQRQDADPTNRKMETEKALLSIRPFAEEVVNGLDLKYEQVYHPPHVHVMDWISDVTYPLTERLLGVRLKERYGVDATVRAFTKSLSAEPVKSKNSESSSNVIAVTLKAHDAQITDKALAALVQRYIAYTNSLNQASGVKALGVIDASLHSAEKDLTQAQQRVREFAAKRGVVLPRVPAQSAPPALPQMLTASAGGMVPTESNGARERSAPPTSSAVGGDAGVLQILKGRLTSAELELAEARQVFTDRTDRVQLLQQNVDDLKQRVSAETERNATNETFMVQLERNLNAAEENYLDLKKRATQIALFLAANPSQSDSRLMVEPPEPPEESDWKQKLAAGVLASAVGLLLGLSLAGLAELGDHRLRNSNDVSRALGIDVLGSVDLMSRHTLRRLMNGELGAMPGQRLLR